MKRILVKGFSLIELMVAMGILSVLMLMLTMVLDQVQQSWTSSESKLSQFREARVAFDVVTKNLGQASLNTYWDLVDENKDGLVDGYFRTSELHFKVMDASDLTSASQQYDPVGHAVFFQAPLGFSIQYRNLNNLFNGRGYFVAFGSDANFRPQFIQTNRYRYRLMEFRPPAESNQVFEDGDEERRDGRPQKFTEWFRQSLSVGDGSFDNHLNPLAENIITMIISPRDSVVKSVDERNDTSSEIAPNYFYDSNDSSKDLTLQQVPPLVRVTMIAIDEASALRLEQGSGAPGVIDGVVSKVPARADKYDDDIDRIVKVLNENRINHKVFSSMVLLRSAKW